jgi:MATE family multidrug resistance protein
VTGGWRDSTRRIVELAWPVFVGQLSMLAFSTIDTFLVARSSAADLAALAIGASAYTTVFVGFMGVIVALMPIVGQLFGAGKLHEAGAQAHQAAWLAIALSVVGCTLLAFPEPFLALSQATPAVETAVRGYLLGLAFSLPASLMFQVYRAFNNAVSRPKAVMLLQLGGLAVKVPLSIALVFGVPALGIPALGVLGCGIATAVAMWSQLLGGLAIVRRDPFYARFALVGRGLDRPRWPALRQQLKLGVPMGLAIGIEVTGFTFMALFIARLGTTAVAGHQIAVNLVSMMFMLPLALSSATSTLVAQRIGAGAIEEARRLGWHATAIGTAVPAAVALLVVLGREGIVALYTSDAAVVAAALPLLAWLALFHIADAAQTMTAAVLRACKVATLPVVIYVAALWGVGLGGGWLLAFDTSGTVPAALRGAPGFWFMSTMGLVLSALALAWLMHWVLRQLQPAAPAQPAG